MRFEFRCFTVEIFKAKLFYQMNRACSAKKEELALNKQSLPFCFDIHGTVFLIHRGGFLPLRFARSNFMFVFQLYF